MCSALVETDQFVRHRIIDPRSEAGLKIHAFLMSRAEKLAGGKIDFAKDPVTFVLSDTREPNAFFSNATHLYPLETPIICVTKGLIDLVDSIDQLDYVLGHELTHYYFKQKIDAPNTKGEELLADLHSVDLMYDAGSDPKQALVLQDNIYKWIEQDNTDYHWKERLKSGWIINWSEIFDVHISKDNRRTALEAALTRLSHLIDQRDPSPIDKSIFAVPYTDPVIDYLNANNYDKHATLGKLRLLIDSVEAVSTTAMPAETYYARELEELEKKRVHIEERYGEYETRDIRAKINEIRAIQADGYKDYYNGPVLALKYQQEIARMAEGLINDENKDRKKTGRPPIWLMQVNNYAINKAYRFISEHGYPNEKAPLYFDATGIMYTYFNELFEKNWMSGLRRFRKGNRPYDPTDLYIAKNEAIQTVQNARNLDELVRAVDTYERLDEIFRDITGAHFKKSPGKLKLERISNVTIRAYSNSARGKIYHEPQVGAMLPWQNLVAIARSSDNARDYVLKLLAKEDIDDFRITHNSPYIRRYIHSAYHIADDGHVIKKAETYNVDFIVYRKEVLDSYALLKSYFSYENAYCNSVCKDVLKLSKRTIRNEIININDEPRTKAEKAFFAFTSLYRTIPTEDAQQPRGSVLSYVSQAYIQNHPLPCLTIDGERKVSDNLLAFENPIFKEHFGADFEETIERKKREHSERMFKTIIQLTDNVAAFLYDVTPHPTPLQKIMSRVWGTKGATNTEHSPGPFMSDAHRTYEEGLAEHIRSAGNMLHALTAPIVSDEIGHDFGMGMTGEQKKIFAMRIIDDEKHVFAKYTDDDRYTAICDSVYAFADQADQVIAGDLSMTPLMQKIANALGYKNGFDKQRLNDDIKYEETPWSSTPAYHRHLRTFDLMRYLEGSSDINLYDMASVIIYSGIDTTKAVPDSADKTNLHAYNTYLQLIQKSRLCDDLARAIANDANYSSLSIADTLKTSDRLLRMKDQITNIFIRNPKDSSSTIEHKECNPHSYLNDPRYINLISVIESNVKAHLEKTVDLILDYTDPMERIEAIYAFYKNEYSDNMSKTSCLDLLEKGTEKNGTSKRISARYADVSFWPMEPEDHIKAFLLAKRTFLKDKTQIDHVQNDILDKIERLPQGDKKTTCLAYMMDKNARAPKPATRERLFKIQTDAIVSQLGVDTGDDRYRNRLECVLRMIANPLASIRHNGKELLDKSIADADKYVLLRQISDAVVTQEAASAMVKDITRTNVSFEQMIKSYFEGVFLDYLMAEMDHRPELANQLLQFLNSKGEEDDSELFQTLIKEPLASKPKERLSHTEKAVLEYMTPVDLSLIYENFWAAPLQVRAVLTDRILKSACPQQSTTEDDQNQWERVFDIVMDTLIPANNTSTESRYARDIMHSYIKARSEYEREIILSAMMVANRNMGEDTGNVGKALKLFLENMGPAEIKVGQAVASHPLTPDSIRVELQQLKNQADIPARWTLYEWIRDAKIPEELWKGQYLGKVRGSASYFTTVDLGPDSVLRILRPEAREKAAKGFAVIGAMIDDLKTKDQTSDLDYSTLTTSVSEMVQQALRMSPIETDLSIGLKQDAAARKIYDGVELSNEGEAYKLKLMKWKEHGQDWALLERAQGPLFNELPETTEAERKFKRNFAKAYVIFEARNILSGHRFDHDRHGAQLCIDPKTNTAGLFDTGAINLREPSQEDQRNLGHILYESMKMAQTDKARDPLTVVSNTIDKKIRDLHQSGQDTQYLIEVKKGFLALGDFFRVLEKDELNDIVQTIDVYDHTSQTIRSAMVEQLPLGERLKFKLYMNGRSLLGLNKRGLLVQQSRTEITGPTTCRTDKPQVKPKSSWFDECFSWDGQNDNATKETRPEKTFTQRMMHLAN